MFQGDSFDPLKAAGSESKYSLGEGDVPRPPQP